MRKFYIVTFIICKNVYYTLWFTNNNDGFILDDDKKHIKSFKFEEDIRVFAVENNLDLEVEITNILCDKNKLLDTQHIDCNYILTFWNIISDISNTIKTDFLGDHKTKDICDIYNKIFYGCNLPAIKNENKNEKFVPKWRNNEKILIQRVIKDGLKILIKSINK